MAGGDTSRNTAAVGHRFREDAWRRGRCCRRARRKPFGDAPALSSMFPTYIRRRRAARTTPTAMLAETRSSLSTCWLCRRGRWRGTWRHGHALHALHMLIKLPGADCLGHELRSADFVVAHSLKHIRPFRHVRGEEDQQLGLALAVLGALE